MPNQLLDRTRIAVVVIDVQEGFRSAVRDFDRLAQNTGTLLHAARLLHIPVLVTEQYPRGLGPTVPEVATALGGTPPLEKVVFAATDANGFDLGNRDQVLLCGVESHVCVYQTAAALLDRRVSVSVVEDAVSSRTEANRRLGLDRIQQAGANRTSVEMALFELLRRAGTDEFKAVQRLIR
jgi:nicotinamidase-related amidase